MIGGAGIALFDVWWLTALAERIPPDKLSRVSSYDWMVSLALLPLGYVARRAAGARLGAVEVLLGGSALAGVALALGLLPRETRMLERLRVSPSSQAPASAAGLPQPLATAARRLARVDFLIAKDDLHSCRVETPSRPSRSPARRCCASSASA